MTETVPFLILPSRKETWATELIGVHQIAVYVICGGGHMGRWAAENPADFEINDPLTKSPYGLEEIRRSVALLARIAQAHGFDPHELPTMPLLHSFGIF